MSQIKNKQKAATTATTLTKKTKIKKQRIKLQKNTFKKLKRRSIKLMVERLDKIVSKDFKYDTIY